MSVSTNTSATFFAMTNWFEVVVKCRLASPKIAHFPLYYLPLAEIGEAFPSFPRAGAWAGRARGAMGYYPAPGNIGRRCAPTCSSPSHNGKRDRKGLVK